MRIKVNSSQMEEIRELTPEYPYTLHRVELDNAGIPWHWHEELEFDYVLEGTVRLNTSGQSWLFQEGEGFFTNTNVLCSLDNVQRCRMESHLFNSVFLSGHFKSVFETKYLNPVLRNKKLDVLVFRNDRSNQRKILGKLRQLGILQNQEDVEFQTRNLLSEIWLLMLDEIENMKEQSTEGQIVNQERMMTMLSYIHRNFARKVTLEEIAGSASISKRECLRCFQNGIHESPFDYLISYRIQQAKKLLESTDLPITEIALESGFSNGAYFSKIFRRECKKTPGEYRAEYHRR